MRAEAVDSGYLAVPDAGGPGVVVLHDVWGLSDHYRDIARRFAGEGFVALAVDLYRDLGDVKVQEPGPWIRSLSDPDVVAVVQRGVDALRAHPAVGARAVGVVGFCMGGMYALLAGARVRGLSAIAPFYGLLSREHGLLHDPAGPDPARKPWAPLDAARDLSCPMIAFFGAEDSLIPMDDVRELERRLSSVPRATEIHVYPGAGHAFMNDTRPALYRPDAARAAWPRLVEFLRVHLARPPGVP